MTPTGEEMQATLLDGSPYLLTNAVRKLLKCLETEKAPELSGGSAFWAKVTPCPKGGRQALPSVT